MRIKIVSFALILGLLALSACSGANEEPSGRENLAPDFTLETIEGKRIVLSDILKDKVVVLDFWTSWCPYCVKMIPQLEKFYTDKKDKVAVIGVNVKESKAKVGAFIQKMGISYPIVLDSGGTIADLYKVRGLPTLVAVDKDSKILYFGHSIEEMKTKIK